MAKKKKFGNVFCHCDVVGSNMAFDCKCKEQLSQARFEIKEITLIRKRKK